MSEPPRRRLVPRSKRRLLVSRAGPSAIGANRRPAVASIALAVGTAILLTAVFVALMFAIPLTTAVLVVVAVVRPAAGRVRRSIRAWRASRLLRGDWWDDFERDLKAYTDPSARRARHEPRL